MRRPTDPPPSHFAPLPFAWGLGMWFGALAGLAAGLWETALLRAAHAPVDLWGCLAVTAAAGAACGWAAGATGVYGPRWGSAAGVVALAWTLSPAAARAAELGAASPWVGLALCVGAGFVLAQIVGRVDMPSAAHQAIGAAGFVVVAVEGPLLRHLVPAATTAGVLGVTALVGLVAIAFAGVAATFTWEGRAPWTPLGVALTLGAGFHGAVATRGPEPALTTDAAVPPVLLIVVSGLRADRVGYHGYVQPRMRASVTPVLDRLAATSVVFEQAHATSNWTVPSLGSILTGRLPYHHGAGLNNGRHVVHTPLRADVRTLPEILHAAGIATVAIVGDPHLRAYGFDSGFDRFLDDPGDGYVPTVLAPLGVLGMDLGWADQADADRQTDLAVQALAELPPAGWFMMVQLADLAGPVLESPYDLDEVGRTHRPYPSDDYDAALRRVDRAIGRITQSAPASTRVIVVGDRGLSLGEVRPDARGALSDPAFGGTMFEEMLHVPLLFATPDAPRVRERAPVSVAAVTPTVLRLLGVPLVGGLDAQPLGPVFGEPQEQRPVLAQSALVGPEQQAVLNGMRKVIQYADGRTPAYDLGVDPSEASIIAPTATESGPDRRLVAELPPRGAGIVATRQPALFLQMGQITRRVFGARRRER